MLDSSELMWLIAGDFTITSATMNTLSFIYKFKFIPDLVWVVQVQITCTVFVYPHIIYEQWFQNMTVILKTLMPTYITKAFCNTDFNRYIYL
jgi:hypothetical protein